MTPVQSRAAAIARLAGLALVLAGSLQAFDEKQADALDAMADLASDIADDLDKLTRTTS